MGLVSVKHSKVVTTPDDGTSDVGSDEWNAGHVITGLENVDNTSDVNKPVSTAQAAAISAAVAGVTKTSLGLGSVDNTADAAKPVSTAQAAAIATKLTAASNLSDLANVATAKANLSLVKGDVGLGNVDNTSDATKNAAVATLSNKTFVAPVLGVATATSLAASGQVSGSQLVASAASPSVALTSSGNGADQNNWDFIVSGTQVLFRSVNDAFTVGNAWLTATRSGATVTGVAIPALTVLPSGTGGQVRSLQAMQSEFPTSTDWDTAAHAVAQAAVLGGTLFVPGGSSFTPVASQNTVSLDFLGPSIAHNPVDAAFPSGSPSSAAHRMFYAQHAGGHSTQAQETLAILSRPVGSGANGPGAMDAALTLSAIKQNFGTTGVQGQVDGLSIYVRNGGTDGVASDAIGVEANIASMGQTGDVFGFEMLSTNFNRSSTVIWQTDIQGGVIDAIGGHMWGFVAAAWTGAGTAAFLAQETAPGSWANFFQGINSTGATAFAVDRNGNVTGTAFKTALSPTVAWGFDGVSSTVTIANGGNVQLAAGRGFVYIEESSAHHAATYAMAAAAVSMTSSLQTIFVAPTTTPAAGHASIAWNGTSGYNIYNNIGGPVTFTVMGFRIGPSA